MKIKLAVIGFFLFCFNTQLFSNEVIYTQEKTDSLVIQKTSPKKEVVIYSGRKIKIWQKNTLSVKGIFKKMNQSILTIAVKGKDVKISIDEIVKLKLIGSTTRKIISWTLVGVGLVGMATGAVFLIAAVAADSGLGSALDLVLAGVTGGSGVLFLTSGGLLGGRKFNLEKKWNIETPNQ